MRFKYRQLHAVRDAEAVAAMKADFQAQAVRPREYFSAGARADDEAPKAVLANESEATHDELVRMLRDGELMPSDLVFSHGAWTTSSLALRRRALSRLSTARPSSRG